MPANVQAHFQAEDGAPGRRQGLANEELRRRPDAGSSATQPLKGNPTMRTLTLAAAAGLIFAPAVARAANTYTVEKWPGDVDTIPCSAWEHYPDGTWALKGYVKIGSSVIENVGFKGDSTARLLDKTCGKK